MNDRYLFKAKRKNWRELQREEWCVQGHYVKYQPHSNIEKFVHGIVPGYASALYIIEIDPSTICQCTGLKDKTGNLIWENDILMCHNNPKDLVKAVFGEFAVIDVDSLEEIEGVIGWHYEVVPTDEISKCKPFCIPMPLTDFYIDRCDMKVCGSIFDNPELLEVE